MVGQKHFSKAYQLALCSVLAALSITIMLTSSLIPILTYAAPLLAGVMLIPIIAEFGNQRGWMTWAVTTMISLIICADREAAFFYCFLGYYPIIKQLFESIKPTMLKLVAKMCFFTIMVFLVFLIVWFIIGVDATEGDLLLNIAACLLMVTVMMIYDLALDRITKFYAVRLRHNLLNRFNQIH